jgi:hypothetical protein
LTTTLEKPGNNWRSTNDCASAREAEKSGIAKPFKSQDGQIQACQLRRLSFLPPQGPCRLGTPTDR